MGLFGNLFDLNHDGKLSTMEKTLDFSAFASIMDDAEAEANEKIADFEIAGLDADELEFMDDDERREVMEEAGLDPDDYDF